MRHYPTHCSWAAHQSLHGTACLTAACRRVLMHTRYLWWSVRCFARRLHNAARLARLVLHVQAKRVALCDRMSGTALLKKGTEIGCVCLHSPHPASRCPLAARMQFMPCNSDVLQLLCAAEDHTMQPMQCVCIIASAAGMSLLLFCRVTSRLTPWSLTR
jgi:hypothetical protein